MPWVNSPLDVWALNFERIISSTSLHCPISVLDRLATVSFFSCAKQELPHRNFMCFPSNLRQLSSNLYWHLLLVWFLWPHLVQKCTTNTSYIFNFVYLLHVCIAYRANPKCPIFTCTIFLTQWAEFIFCARFYIDSHISDGFS